MGCGRVRPAYLVAHGHVAEDGIHEVALGVELQQAVLQGRGAQLHHHTTSHHASFDQAMHCGNTHGQHWVGITCIITTGSKAIV